MIKNAYITIYWVIVDYPSLLEPKNKVAAAPNEKEKQLKNLLIEKNTIDILQKLLEAIDKKYTDTNNQSEEIVNNAILDALKSFLNKNTPHSKKILKEEIEKNFDVVPRVNINAIYSWSMREGYKAFGKFFAQIPNINVHLGFGAAIEEAEVAVKTLLKKAKEEAFFPDVVVIEEPAVDVIELDVEALPQDGLLKEIPDSNKDKDLNSYEKILSTHEALFSPKRRNTHDTPGGDEDSYTYINKKTY